MLTDLFFPRVAGVRVERLWRDGAVLHMRVTATRRWARCPLCQRRSKRRHSQYERTLADLPCVGERVVAHLRVRRFVCRVRWCRRKIFAERLPALVAPFARRTTRLTEQVLQTAFDLGGDPGVRHLAGEGVQVSARTLLRLVRAVPIPDVGPVRVLSVDDWARRRGRTYGTILVNLETHTVIDVLPDREAVTLAAWLRLHPEIEVVSRDRAGAYAEGIRQGAPQAIQVADRWHLMKNVGDAVARALTRRYRALRAAAEAVLHDEQEHCAALSASTVLAPAPDAFPSAPLARFVASRALDSERRQERYEAIQDLRRQGVTISEVARRLHLARPTVRKLARAETCPGRVPRRHLLAPFEPYLRYRWAQGCRNARALFDELQSQGYRGSYPHLRHALRDWRDEPARHGRSAWIPMPAPPTMPRLHPISPRHASWLLLCPAEDLDDTERAFLTHLLTLCPQVHTIQDLARRFCTLVRERDAAALEPWLRATEVGGCTELRGFAQGLRRDRAAVDAALTLAWSQGPTEGKVNKLKVLKRTAYGRSAFDLLRIRVLHAA